MPLPAQAYRDYIHLGSFATTTTITTVSHSCHRNDASHHRPLLPLFPMPAFTAIGNQGTEWARRNGDHRRHSFSTDRFLMAGMRKGSSSRRGGGTRRTDLHGKVHTHGRISCLLPAKHSRARRLPATPQGGGQQTSPFNATAAQQAGPTIFSQHSMAQHLVTPPKAVTGFTRQERTQAIPPAPTRGGPTTSKAILKSLLCSSPISSLSTITLSNHLLFPLLRQGHQPTIQPTLSLFYVKPALPGPPPAAHGSTQAKALSMPCSTSPPSSQSPGQDTHFEPLTPFVPLELRSAGLFPDPSAQHHLPLIYVTKTRPCARE